MIRASINFSWKVFGQCTKQKQAPFLKREAQLCPRNSTRFAIIFLRAIIVCIRIWREKKNTFLKGVWHEIFNFRFVALPEYFPLLWACSTYWRKVWAVVNTRLDSCKHINTLCGDSTISKPYWTAFCRIKWALQDVSELGFLFLTNPVTQ